MEKQLKELEKTTKIKYKLHKTDYMKALLISLLVFLLLIKNNKINPKIAIKEVNVGKRINAMSGKATKAKLMPHLIL